MKDFILKMLAVGVAVLSSLTLIACVNVPRMPELSPEILKSIAFARSQASTVGANIWPQYEKAPFGLLLTLEDREVLFCHKAVVGGFRSLPTDSVTTCDLQERENVFGKNFLAAMPVINGLSTIVMGTPKSTGNSVADWTRIIFHEHFHQYQTTFHQYYLRLNDLGLSNGDTTGMWMLNYPFPYKNEKFNVAFSVASRALKAAVLSNSADLERLAAVYLQERQKLEMTVTANDWKYLELGLWAEGVARWTEIEIAKQSADQSVVASGKSLREKTLSSLTVLNPIELEREIVYPYGAAESMLLERCKKDWRLHYPKTMSLGAIVKTIDPSQCFSL